MGKEKCCKARYTSRPNARKALQKLRGSGLPSEGLRPYRCVECSGMWHLGHLPAAIIKGKVTRKDVYGDSG